MNKLPKVQLLMEVKLKLNRFKTLIFLVLVFLVLFLSFLSCSYSCSGALCLIVCLSGLALSGLVSSFLPARILPLAGPLAVWRPCSCTARARRRVSHPCARSRGCARACDRKCRGRVCSALLSLLSLQFLSLCGVFGADRQFLNRRGNSWTARTAPGRRHHATPLDSAPPSLLAQISSL